MKKMGSKLEAWNAKQREKKEKKKAEEAERQRKEAETVKKSQSFKKQKTSFPTKSNNFPQRNQVDQHTSSSAPSQHATSNLQHHQIIHTFSTPLERSLFLERDFAERQVCQTLFYLEAAGFKKATELLNEYHEYKQNNYSHVKYQSRQTHQQGRPTSTLKSKGKKSSYLYTYRPKDPSNPPFEFQWYPKGICHLTSKEFYDANKKKIDDAAKIKMDESSDSSLYNPTPDFS